MDPTLQTTDPLTKPAESAMLATPATVTTVTSESILKGQAEVLIAHGADIYRLRLTRNGKLILHK